ncbi:MAG: hypothetical protein WC869_06820 [Phycisphaerae bacterium]|jgi:hypothetical protein
MTRRRTGFTALELTLSILIMSITSLSVAGVTMAISKAHASTEDYYQSIQTGRSAMLKIQSLVQSSKLATYCSANTVVLWLDDTNGNNLVNMDEIGVISFASGQIKFSRCSFPANIQAALNTAVPLSSLTNATSIVPQILNSTYAPAQLLTTDVSSCIFSATPTPPLATLVKVNMTVGVGTQKITLRSAASTRAGLTSKVGISGGQYVLIGG